MNELARLYRRIGYEFNDEALIEEALSHRSHGSPNYERLEYLGDSLLNFVIADELHAQYPNLDEGALSRLRASLVRGSTLAGIAREQELGEFLRMGTGELRSGGFNRDSTLADLVESIIGAVFRDADFDTARALVMRLFEHRLQNTTPVDELKDPKTRLQELLQGRGLDRPTYTVVKTEGKSHELAFTVSCQIPSYNVKLSAVATSRRKAEQAAAAEVLDRAEELLPLSTKQPAT